MIIPGNISIYFLPECDGCNICEPTVKEKNAGYIITCEHYQACRRVAMHVKGDKSSQKMQGV